MDTMERPSSEKMLEKIRAEEAQVRKKEMDSLRSFWVTQPEQARRTLCWKLQEN